MNSRLTAETSATAFFQRSSLGLPGSQYKHLPLQTSPHGSCWLCVDPPPGRSSSHRRGHCNCRLEDKEMAAKPSILRGPSVSSCNSTRHFPLLGLMGWLFHEERCLSASRGLDDLPGSLKSFSSKAHKQQLLHKVWSATRRTQWAQNHK